MWETSPAGPFDRWPTGLGFESFYGFLGAETIQFEPALYDETTPIEPPVDREDYHLTEDLTDGAIEWIRNQKLPSTEQAVLPVLRAGWNARPHHVRPEWAAASRASSTTAGITLRERTLARQLELGVVPQDGAVTPRPEQLPVLGGVSRRSSRWHRA